MREHESIGANRPLNAAFRGSPSGELLCVLRSTGVAGMLRIPTFCTGPSLDGGPSGSSESPSKYSLGGPSERVGASIKRSVQSAPYPPSGDVHAGCDWRKKSSSCRSVSSARDASVLLDPRGE